MRALKKPHGKVYAVRNLALLIAARKELRPPANGHGMNNLVIRSSSPVKLSDNSSPGCKHHDCKLRRDYEPEQPNQSPTFLTHRNNSDKRVEF